MSFRFAVFSAAPHRMMFFGGVVQMLLALVFWAVELGGRFSGLWAPLSVSVDSTYAHAWLMIYGLFPFFMFGFLMTTYPRWMNGPLVPARHYVASFALLSAGVLLVYVGLWFGKTLAMFGVLMHLLGFASAVYALFAVYRAVGKRADRRYETHLNAALAFGLLGELSYLLWLWLQQPALLNAALHAGLWLFLMPVLVIVGHRMIPYFTSNVLSNYVVVQPRWSLPVLWAGVAGHVALDFAGMPWARAVPDAALLFLGAHHSLHWGFRRSLSVPLLGALHIAFAWFSVGMALYLIDDLALGTSGFASLGRAPLHALGIGFIAGMVIAMVTRVSRGHSGRPLTMDRLDWWVFLAVIAIALVRIGAEAGMPWLNFLAALLWLMAVTPWAARYLWIYLRPRLDGKPG